MYEQLKNLEIYFDLIMAPDIFKRMAVEESNRNIVAGVTEKDLMELITESLFINNLNS